MQTSTSNKKIFIIGLIVGIIMGVILTIVILYVGYKIKISTEANKLIDNEYNSEEKDTDKSIENNLNLDYPEGYLLYEFPITTESAYGNSLFPGNNIDIYLKAIRINDKEEIVFGKLLENIKVLTVLDINDNYVFENLEEKREPTSIVFALPKEEYNLINKVKDLGKYETTMIPVPTTENLKNQDEIILSSEDIKDFINQIQ